MKTKARETYKAIFGEDYVEDKYKLEPHVFIASGFGKQYCRKCGLVALNNPFSIWAHEKGCYNELHPQYNQKRKLTNPFR